MQVFVRTLPPSLGDLTKYEPQLRKYVKGWAGGFTIYTRGVIENEGLRLTWLPKFSGPQPSSWFISKSHLENGGLTALIEVEGNEYLVRLKADPPQTIPGHLAKKSVFG